MSPEHQGYTLMLDFVKLRHKVRLDSNTRDPTVGPLPRIPWGFIGFIEISIKHDWIPTGIG